MKRLIFSLSLASAPFATAAPTDHEIVVYGGTSGGVMAAVQAARSGKSVVLISPTAHLGGMTASGLGWTDLGDDSILGGLGREFYHRLYLHYQDDASWDWQAKTSFPNAGQGGPAFNDATGIASVFEPGVAESVFGDFISEEGVTVVTGRLDLAAGVVMNAGRISHLRLEDGSEYSGRMFIDASYEGDLLPGAGVAFTVGREANSTHGESYNGIQTARATKNQLPAGIDPQVVPGDPGSGLLPGVEPDAGGPDGSGDDSLQAYCFRMVLTDVAANRVAIGQPAGYDEAAYELLFRAIEAGQTSGFFKFSLMPNRKTDSNNSGGISTDYIGRNHGPGWSWATLDHDQRLALAGEHEHWQRGLVWTLQNHPRVPASIRSAHAGWGLAADEFADNGNWPYQIYVRECRRMVSDVVMNQGHCSGSLVAPDSVGLAAYSMDSHNVRRHAAGGTVRNEGDVQMSVPRPYPVSYGSLVPARGECANLLVPWSLSASHMAFGSIRMEPVFMSLAQSAAIAAAMAIDRQCDVQDVPYGQLRPALLAAGQALGDPVSGTTTPEVVIDNSAATDVVITGDWLSSSASPGFYGADYLHDSNTGQGTKQVFYRIAPAVPGNFRVFLRWTSNANRASRVPVEIRHAGGTTGYTVDQRTRGGLWIALGIHPFSGAPGEGLVIRTTGADGYVIADAAGVSAVDLSLDTDGDGISDVHEAELGLDPELSDADFIAALKAHPEILGLHSAGEIHDLRLTAPSLAGSAAAGFQLGFSLESGDGAAGWSLLEAFDLAVAGSAERGFFRLALAPEPAGFLAALAAGQPRRIVVYGTSLTANGSWPARINSWLSAKYPGLVTVINSGLSGKSSHEGLLQLDAKVLAHDPDVVMIEFAVNDAFRYSDGTPQLGVADARANLTAMIDAILAHKPSAEIILQTTNPVWNSPAGSNQSATLRPELAAFYQMYRDVAAGRRLMIVDHQPHWEALRQDDRTTFEAYVPDGVHPTVEAQDRVLLPLLRWKLGGGRPLP